MTVKNNHGNNSDIDNKSKFNIVFLRILNECSQRFNQHLADQLVENKWCIAHRKGLNHEPKNIFTHVSLKDPEWAFVLCGSH